jgi:hypothetical protein
VPLPLADIEKQAMVTWLPSEHWLDTGEVAELVNQAADHGAVRADLLAIADDMARRSNCSSTEILEAEPHVGLAHAE